MCARSKVRSFLVPTVDKLFWTLRVYEYMAKNFSGLQRVGLYPAQPMEYAETDTARWMVDPATQCSIVYPFL